MRLFFILSLFISTLSFAQIRISWPQVIFSERGTYAAFPSIAKNPKTNELFLSFRVAEQRDYITHVDSTAEVKFWRSKDQGKTWKSFAKFSKSGNSIQEASLTMTPDLKLIAHTYQWNNLTKDYSYSQTSEDFGLYGGKLFIYDVEKKDTEINKWERRNLPGVEYNKATQNNIPVPSFNRGTTAIDDNGRYYMASYIFDSPAPSRKFSVYLLVSDDQGKNWKVESLIATHPTASLSETSIYITPKKTMIAFIRMEDGEKKNLAIARSYNMGKSFEPIEETEVMGHPFNPLKMVDGKILLTYGHRTYPRGIRSLILDPEAKNIRAGKEIILRKNGKTGDLGYPWAVHLEGDKYMVVYYMKRWGVSSILRQTIDLSGHVRH